MHLKKDFNITEFLKQVTYCQGEVYFETPEGDSLSLKSALSQYIFCSLTNEDDIFRNGTIRTELEQDKTLLAYFLE